MRRYRGTDKPPGPTLSPPPYSRNTSSRSNAGSTRRSSGGHVPRQALSGITTTPVSENELFMMRGLATASAPFLDPRTKRPMIPPAGRTVPKLKMADLTSSLGPLVESQMVQQQQKSPLSLADKRIAETIKEVTATKDMLESFDDAIKVPDIRAINSRVAQLRKGIGPSSNHSTKTSSSRLGNISQSKPKATSSETRKFNAAKVSPKNEEQNIRKLMGQLKEKYLDDMESQLGLAIEPRPKGFLQAESLIGDGSQDQGGDGPRFGVAIPRPSTNATEITARIDKVVREWATESQKLSTVMKAPASSKQQQSRNGLAKINSSSTPWQKMGNDSNDNSINHDGQNATSNSQALNATTGKNKNLAKISSAFRKSLDPISKRDVRELINFPDEDHVEKLEQEHEERRRAHESVFKNAVIKDSSSEDKGSATKNKSNKPPANNSVQNKHSSRNTTTDDGESNSESMIMDQNRTKSSLVTPKQKPLPSAKKTVAKNDDEFSNIIREHMEYETTGGPPKLTISRKHTDILRKPTSRTLNTDVSKSALLKYSDSHKKLQNVVDSFTDKVDSSVIKKRPGPETQTDDSDQSEDERQGIEGKTRSSLPASSAVSLSTMTSRRRNATAASLTLNRSMKTIDRASSVAQRLGTLMSRVALRNEAYDYEKQQEAKETSENSISLATDYNNNNLPGQPVSPQQHSIKALSTQTEYEHHRPNPYESQSLSSNKNDFVFERPNVSPGVSKLDSTQFGKYVEEMKKVAEKAAASFEKFKVRQVKNDTDLTSLSEDDSEDVSNPEYTYQGGGEAAAVAAAAAEIAALQEQEKNRKAVFNRGGQARRNISQKSSTPRKPTNVSDAGTSPRESEMAELLSQINRNTGSRNNNSEQERAQFKFVPDMSYTDQLMLQKLRRLKEREGWQGSLLSEENKEAENETLVGDVPDHAEIESMIKRSTSMGLPKETERPSMGPVSLNAILRSRINSNNNAKK